MRLELSLDYEIAYNCFDNLIIPISKYWNKDYELMSLNSWCFPNYNKLSETEELLGRRLSFEFGTRLDFLANYHGIKVTRILEDNPNKIINHIKSELSLQRPVAVYVDSFWCPWYTTHYQKVKSDHYCLVIGIEPNNDLRIIDSQFATHGAILPFQTFIRGCGDYYTFESIEIKNKDVDWKVLILDSLVNLEGTGQSLNAFDQIRQFAEDIVDKLNIEDEIRGYEDMPFNADIFQNLFELSRRRKQYALALSYFAKKYGVSELELLSKQIKAIGDRWSSSFGLLSKAYYMNGDPRLIKRLSIRISDLANDEEKIYGSLKKLCKTNTMFSLEEVGLSKNDHDNSKIDKYIFLGLEEYADNKGFGDSLDQSCTAELPNGGRYFYTEGLPSKDIWNIDNMAFKVLMPKNKIKDNIACMGQVISVNRECQDYIMFLGCSELGDHSEYIEVEYSDGCTEKVPLEFTNWGKSEANYGEIIAWTGKGVERSKNQVIIFPFLMSIFAKNYELNHKNFIKNIKLPYCPNIHIFAITLGRKVY